MSRFYILMLIWFFLTSCTDRIFIDPEAEFEPNGDYYLLKKGSLKADFFILSSGNWHSVLQDCDRKGVFKLFYIPAGGYYRLSSVTGSDTVFAGEHFLSQTDCPGLCKVVMLDVKQGDSFVLFPPGVKPLVFDGGYGSTGFETWQGSGEKVLLNYLQNQRIDSVSYLMESHHHADHYGGLEDVINSQINYQSYLTSGLSPSVRLLDTLKFGKQAGGIILHADQTAEFKDNENNRSLVLKFFYGSFDLLLTGDAENAGETDMITGVADSRIFACDVLKAGHHGSNTASSAALLKLVKPQSVLISYGLNNPYNHPAPAALDRLESYSEELSSTDKDGDVTILTDGTAYQIIK